MGGVRLRALPRRRGLRGARSEDRASRLARQAGARGVDPGAAGKAAPRAERGHRADGRGHFVLGAAPPARQARLSPSASLRPGARLKFGIDRLLEERALQKRLRGRRLALLAHPASVTKDLIHSLDAIAAQKGLKLTAAFGPQHGLRGDKQDNMVESADFVDAVHGIPIFSLYGEVRRPSAAMMDAFDVLLVDLQDVGCRVYTFVTTLRYVFEEAAGR